MPNIPPSLNPKRSDRGDYQFFEVALAPGPQAIGDTGDNSFQQLFGREWILFLDRETDRLHLFQEDAEEDGAWSEVAQQLPPLFDDPLPAGVRRVSMAFDQSARIIIAYEVNGHIFLTRWDTNENAYKQNVDFAGHDPIVFMDASVADPMGYPSLENDGFSVREAFFAGVRVLFEWLPNGQWLVNAIPDSDVVIFYLTPNRMGVRARAQRQLYQTAHPLHDFDDPVVMDKAQALAGHYQLLVSDASGDPLPSMLISDPYLGNILIAPEVGDGLAAHAAPEAVRAEAMIYPEEPEGRLAATAAPEVIAAIGDTYPVSDNDDLDAGVAPEGVLAEAQIMPVEDHDELDSSVTPEGILVEQVIIRHEEEDELDGTVTPEAIRVQAIS